MTKRKTVIGIDPDADKHGVAVYEEGRLTDLKMMTLAEILDSAWMTPGVAHFGIENVMNNKFMYARNTRSNKTLQSKIAMSVGRCQQAQVELVRILESRGITYTLYPPVKGNWADKKALFERVTGWKGRSNADTRSAAYFGYMSIK